jgi:hypothetical protein
MLARLAPTVIRRLGRFIIPNPPRFPIRDLRPTSDPFGPKIKVAPNGTQPLYGSNTAVEANSLSDSHMREYYIE